MDTQDVKLTTGLPGLDHVLKGLIPGDNVVWQIDSVEDYLQFVLPFAASARAEGKKLVYFRFASHKPLLARNSGAEIHELDPDSGFETFLSQIHAVIEKAGRGAFYVFDCLSELAGDWYSDQMLGNFFMLTCPYLYDMETIAYFALFRNHHSRHATEPIAETTQLLLEILKHNNEMYVRPIKVQHRFSPTMHMLHSKNGSDFTPVTSSAVISEILATSSWSGLGESAGLDLIARTVIEARETIKAAETGRGPLPRMVALFNHLTRMIITRDQKILSLVSQYFTLDDVLSVEKRMIGSGLIGGKTVGMLLARAVLRNADRGLAARMETHDSFYIGSDVFYTFLVRNGVWWVRQKQRDPKTFLEGAEQARRRILTGKFPDYILKQFEQMLDYFGQSPFIVRSSSLLEDGFGNSFAGKYDSVFCANQGPRERRLEDFLAAVRSIYASTMSERALRYRANRDLLDKDEQMALLVMRVSGSLHHRLHYPDIAGVGFSFNPFAWNKAIDPKAGVLRLVFGLGTRAVNRADDDYTRIVAVNQPEMRPESSMDQVRRYSQRRVDVLDLEANQLVSTYYSDIAAHMGNTPLHLFASPDRASETLDARDPRTWVLTFNGLLEDTPFIKDMSAILKALEKAYDYPVDIEFTLNFTSGGEYRINILQCRPLQTRGTVTVKIPKTTVPEENRVLEARCAVVGQSRNIKIDRVIYVVPEVYGHLPLRDRYDVAKVIGQINQACSKEESILLIGPGRWGTSSPELGVPVAFPDINRISIICELVMMREDFVPDVSLGTHFLNELVEQEMLYLALFPHQEGTLFNKKFFEETPSTLLKLMPSASSWQHVIRVLDTRGHASSHKKSPLLRLAADSMEQRVLCWLDTLSGPHPQRSHK